MFAVVIGLLALAQTPHEDAARKLYEEGQTFYNLGEYQKAVGKFKEGYRLSKAPGFIYNIAQAYRLSGDCNNALQSYKSFLRLDPGATQRPKVEQHIEEMNRCVKNEKVTEKPPIIVQQPPPAEDPLQIVGFTSVGLAAVSLGLGVYFGVEARLASDHVSSLATAGGDWTDLDRDIEERGQRMETLTITALVVSGVVGIIGAILLWPEAEREGAKQGTSGTSASSFPGWSEATLVGSDKVLTISW